MVQLTASVCKDALSVRFSRLTSFAVQHFRQDAVADYNVPPFEPPTAQVYLHVGYLLLYSFHDAFPAPWHKPQCSVPILTATVSSTRLRLVQIQYNNPFGLSLHSFFPLHRFHSAIPNHSRNSPTVTRYPTYILHRVYTLLPYLLICALFTSPRSTQATCFAVPRPI